MNVWLVFENDVEGSFLVSVWSTEKLADDACDALNAPRAVGEKCFSVEPYVVDSGAAA